MARWFHKPKVAGSSPASATKLKEMMLKLTNIDGLDLYINIYIDRVCGINQQIDHTEILCVYTQYYVKEKAKEVLNKLAFIGQLN